MNFAIIGATGNVGRKTIDVLQDSKLKISNLFLVASRKSAGKIIVFKNKKIKRLWNFSQSEKLSPLKIPHTSLFIKKEIIDELNYYDKNFKISSDTDFLIRLSKKPYRYQKIEDYINIEDGETCENWNTKEKINLKKGQQIMTDMLDTFHKLCKKHDLKYWLIGGTLVGQIRHKGWVPWDGDIDVGMEKSEYEKFLHNTGKTFFIEEDP